MTTEELAEYLGVAKQTVNRWVREKGWKTEKLPDVRDGRVKFILVDAQIYESIQNTPAFHSTLMFLGAEEPPTGYTPGIRTPAYRQIISAVNNMIHSEQEKVAQFLPRGGIHNFLVRLDIDESA